MAIEFDNSQQVLGATIKIIGVGGCGGNAVDNMIERGITGVDFIACNTDIQALYKSKAPIRIQIGKNLTKGRGAGAKPEMGKQSAEEDRDELMRAIEGAEMLFVTAGMGKGTGTGAAPVIAQMARNMGILTVAIVTKPFTTEGDVKARLAEEGIKQLRESVDTLITVPNDKILAIVGKDKPAYEALAVANDVLYKAARGISEIITESGFMNVDFNDVRAIMVGAGDALMGSATASGENRAVKAATDAITSPLLEGVSIQGATGILVNVTMGSDVSMHEFDEVAATIKQLAGGNALIITGMVIKEDQIGTITVTVIATGFSKKAAAVPPQFGIGQRATLPASTHTPIATPATLRIVKEPDPVKAREETELPAYLRRGVSTPTPVVDKSEKPEERPASPLQERPDEQRREKINKTDSDMPAFMRKIMD
jgi:cell division protein FtsZ